jgi:hypothetical protein
MRNNITNHLINIPGWRTNRKIIVIESDDWGSIRMPDKNTYNSLLSNGIQVDKDLFCRYDALATEDDLNELYSVLETVKDKNGHSAVLTANAVVANPDFDKIRESAFKSYYYESIEKTITNQYNPQVWNLWHEGIEKGVFHPQFHGREHLNVKSWLKALQNNEFATRLAFDFKTFGLTDATSQSIKTHYMGAFNSKLEKDIQFYEMAIFEGLNLFEKLFGYRSTSFIATTYTWSPLIEPILMNNGIEYLQGLVNQKIPLDGGDKFKYIKGNFQGKRNKTGQFYLMRNCFFEPTHFREKFDVVDDCLKRIDIAFRWKKAAVIGAHRLNFIGAIDETNRTKNLVLFQNLLSKIVKKWPDVEFMSSDQLGNIIKYNKLTI